MDLWKDLPLLKRVKKEGSLHEIISRYLEDVDVVFTEVLKKEDFPKIEVMRKDVSLEPLSDSSSLLLMISDFPVDISIPCFKLEKVSKVTDFLEAAIKNFSVETKSEKGS